MSGFGGHFGQAVQVRVGHHHHVARGVREGVQADHAVLAAQDQPAGGFGLLRLHAVGDGVVNRGDQIAEDAVVIAGPGREAGRNAGARVARGVGDVGVAPGSPEKVHERDPFSTSIEGWWKRAFSCQPHPIAVRSNLTRLMRATRKGQSKLAAEQGNFAGHSLDI
jgi:hypothetical protein